MKETTRSSVYEMPQISPESRHSKCSSFDPELANVFFVTWQTAGYPSVEDVDGRQVAKAFVKQYFSKKWQKRKDESLLYRALKEITRPNGLFPGLVDEVWIERKGENRLCLSDLDASKTEQKRRTGNDSISTKTPFHRSGFGVYG
jgi:hypothetical protein